MSFSQRPETSTDYMYSRGHNSSASRGSPLRTSSTSQRSSKRVHAKVEWSTRFASSTKEGKLVSSLRARVHQLEELNAGLKPPQSVLSRMLILQGRDRSMREELEMKEKELQATSARVKLTRNCARHG